ncbi:MAG: T9SS type A sorting domain-containing protein, partial [Syntrophothermus sp.]
KCHVSQNFVKFANDPLNYRDTILVTGENKQPITCQTCHDPHSAQYEGQLRFPLSNVKTICDECHTSEIDSVDINAEPHHTTSEVLSGSANFGYRYPGETYINSGHTYAALKRCVNCHVFATPFANGMANTGHTFAPRVEACRSCHSDYYTAVDTGNVLKKFDYRGVQSQIDSLIAALENKLSHASPADSQTISFKQAEYNYLSIINEGSRGIHNTRLVRKLLLDALGRFNPTAVEQEIGLPSTYTISQNYPNPFNPSTSIKFSLPQAGNVKITIYDAIGKVVEVLVNDYYNQGNYKVDWNASHYSSGIYLYKIEVNDFSSVKKMVLIK